jgi:hypothetical protein
MKFPERLLRFPVPVVPVRLADAPGELKNPHLETSDAEKIRHFLENKATFFERFFFNFLEIFI